MHRSELESAVLEAIDRLDPAARLSLTGESSTRIEVHLKSITSHLCASGWGVFGLGDKRSLSGEATFDFDWSLNGATTLRQGNSKVKILLSKKEATPSQFIFRESVSRLVRQIVEMTPPN